jgi:hypothetical protein
MLGGYPAYPARNEALPPAVAPCPGWAGGLQTNTGVADLRPREREREQRKRKRDMYIGIGTVVLIVIIVIVVLAFRRGI